MKKLQSIILVMFIAIVATVSTSYAQNYKQQFSSVDAKGKITDEDGKHLGWVTSEGVIKDSTGTKIAHVDKNGNVIDMRSGKSIGKAAKNGNFVYHFDKSTTDSLTVSAPMNGTCEVKDKSGKTVLLVHESYKQYGACAYHCLKMKNEHKDMKMK